jgi:hypothetical protein
MNFLAKNRALLSASMGLIFTVGGLYLFGWSLLVVQVFLLVDLETITSGHIQYLPNQC